MALGGHRVQVVGWAVGLVVCIAVTAVIPELELRVELGFVAGAAVAAVIMATFTWIRMSGAGSGALDALIDGLEHEPIEI